MIVEIQKKKLSARILAVNFNSAKIIEGIPLSGDLREDRKKLHQISDTIHKALFGQEGIAATRILYTVKSKGNDNKWVSEVWEADYDEARRSSNHSRLRLLRATPVYIPPAPGYSSGGFFYVSYLNGQPKIYYASFKGNSGQRFTYMRGNQLMPAISRQRDQVAFVSDAAGNPDIFLQDFSVESGPIGKPRQIFAAKQAAQGTPVFSPNGKQIAFVSNKDGAARIYVMDIPAPGTSLKDIKTKFISRQTRESTAPAWSPDGKKLAYCGSSGSHRQIWVYDFETGMERQLTQGAGNKENPTWAPNSLHLIFNSTGPDGSELYLINLNQPQSKKITAGPGEKHYPNWRN